MSSSKKQIELCLVVGCSDNLCRGPPAGVKIYDMFSPGQSRGVRHSARMLRESTMSSSARGLTGLPPMFGRTRIKTLYEMLANLCPPYFGSNDDDFWHLGLIGRNPIFLIWKALVEIYKTKCFKISQINNPVRTLRKCLQHQNVKFRSNSTTTFLSQNSLRVVKRGVLNEQRTSTTATCMFIID